MISVKRFCCNPVEYRPLTVDPTFDFDPYNVTPISYQRLTFLRREDGKCPTMIGPVLLREKKTQFTYSLLGGILKSLEENYLDAAQLHELFLASCQPGVATHQAQLSKLYPAVYNPPGFPFYGGRFIIHTLTHHRSFRSGTPSSDLVYSTRPSAAAGAWHLGLSSYCYYLVALTKNVKKCYGCGDNFSEKISSVTTQHRGQALRPSGGTQGREHRSVRAQRRLFQHLLPPQSCTYYEKRPCF